MAAASVASPGKHQFRRSSSKRSLRRPVRTPSLSTVWEFAGNDFVDAVPSTEDMMSDEVGGCTCARGRLYLRQTGIFPVRLFGRRSFNPRYAVLSPSSTGGPPRLQLYLVSKGGGTAHELSTPSGCLALPDTSPRRQLSLPSRAAARTLRSPRLIALSKIRLLRDLPSLSLSHHRAPLACARSRKRWSS